MSIKGGGGGGCVEGVEGEYQGGRGWRLCGGGGGEDQGGGRGWRTQEE